MDSAKIRGNKFGMRKDHNDAKARNINHHDISSQLPTIAGIAVQNSLNDLNYLNGLNAFP